MEARARVEARALEHLDCSGETGNGFAGRKRAPGVGDCGRCRRVRRALRSRRGETITEVLCAVLVAAFAMAILGGLLGVASRFGAMAREKDEAIYGALSAAEATSVWESKESGESQTGTIDVYVDGTAEADTVSFAVTYYGAEGTLISYQVSDGETAANTEPEESTEDSTEESTEAGT